VTAFGNEDVRRLDVAVHDAFGMRRVQRIGDFNRDREQLFRFERTPGDAILQRLSLQAFHNYVGLLARVADLVNGADIRMAQRGRSSRLTPEAFQRMRIARQFVGQKFQRDEAAQLSVFGFVNHAHAPAAELFKHAVARHGLACHGSYLSMVRRRL
jgi:hypothetical protein